MEGENALQAQPAQTGELIRIGAFDADIEQVKGVLAENLGAGGLTVFDLQRIKIPAGGGIAFEVPSLAGVDLMQTLRAVILFAHDARTYWKESFEDTGGGRIPDCHSNDGRNGIGNPGGICGLCPLNEFGSASKGKGKGCKEVKQLFILREGSDGILPEVLVAPPSSLRGWKQFAIKLGSRGVPISSVIVEIGLLKSKSETNVPYSQATFTPIRVLTADERAKVKEFSNVIRPLVESSVNIDAQEPMRARRINHTPAF